MLLVTDFEDFESVVAARSQLLHRNGIDRSLVGVVLMPTPNVIVEEIVQSLDYWQARSGNFFDFYFPGIELSRDDGHFTGDVARFFKHSMAEPRGYELSELDQYSVRQSPAKLSEFIDMLDERIVWASHEDRGQPSEKDGLHFSGNTELVMLEIAQDAYGYGSQKMLDYSGAVRLNLTYLNSHYTEFDLQRFVETLRRMSMTGSAPLTKEIESIIDGVGEERSGSLPLIAVVTALYRAGVVAKEVIEAAILLPL